MSDANSDCTVVMATYNGAKYLAEQLASLEAQAMPPRRLIVSDDGSTDETRDILASFAKDASFDVTIIDGPQRGYPENFWSAAKLADTKYVSWADQDDVWNPQKIMRCVQALEETGATYVTHSATVVDSELRPLGRSVPGYRRTRVLAPLQGDPFYLPQGFSTVFRRELLSEIDWNARPTSHNHSRQLGHDEMIGLAAFALHSRVELSDLLSYYRQHDSNTVGDPSITGLRHRISAALQVSAENHYAILANRAEGYAQYLSELSEPDIPAVLFFRAAAERVRFRAKVRSGKTRIARTHALMKSVTEGNYRSREDGGFGFPAFLNDSFALFLSMANAFSSPAEN